jgi:peptidyl-prolyl cis-trans isomerase D
VFNFALYEESARALYGSTAKFEATLKEDLLFQKMMTAVRATVKLSDAEVRAAWEAEADKVNLRFLRFPLTAVEPLVKVTPEEVKAFAAQEGARIEEFHRANAARFDQPNKVRVRHILVKVAPGGDDAAAKKKIARAEERLGKGEDFAKVAQAMSEDERTKVEGGDLGYVSEGLFDDAIAASALSLERGQVSRPVRTASGWHLLKAEEVVAAKKIPLDQARETIAREVLSSERALAQAHERAGAVLAAAKAGKPLEAVKLGSRSIAPEETGPFVRATPFAPKLDDVPGLLADAFATKAGQPLPKVYDTPSGPVVAVVKQREAADPKAFEDQREAVENRLRLRKESHVEGTWLRALREGAKIDKNSSLLAANARGE